MNNMEDKNNKGRPTKYTEEIIEKTIEYLEMCKDEEDEFHKTRGEKSDGYDRLVRVNIPTIGGLARHLNISRETIYTWCKEADKKDFSDIIDQLQAEQESRLINNGLSGFYNPTIAKVLLSKHGYREGIDNTTNDKDLPTPILGTITKLNDIQTNNSTEQDTEVEEEG